MGIFPSMTQLQEEAAKAQRNRDEVKRAQIISIANAIINCQQGAILADYVVDTAFEIYDKIEQSI